MRPPGGGYNTTVKENVGMPMILWSIDTLDWKTRDATSTYNAVISGASSGDIVLMHDLYEATAEASKRIIPYLVDKGFMYPGRVGFYIQPRPIPLSSAFSIFLTFVFSFTFHPWRICRTAIQITSPIAK